MVLKLPYREIHRDVDRVPLRVVDGALDSVLQRHMADVIEFEREAIEGKVTYSLSHWQFRHVMAVELRQVDTSRTVRVFYVPTELPIADLSLPDAARPICVYRNGDDLIFAEPDTRLRRGDQVVLLTNAHTLGGLRERFG